ncbi:MAG: hypothetical protein LAE24_01320 [Candidatus Contendobacter sp.]|nr:hypothetical protein [Candidatus Contendobacter sp.]
MTDDDIVFDEDNPRTQPEDWDNAIVLLQTESEFPVSGYSGNPTVRVGN